MWSTYLKEESDQGHDTDVGLEQNKRLDGIDSMHCGGKRKIS